MNARPTGLHGFNPGCRVKIIDSRHPWHGRKGTVVGWERLQILGVASCRVRLDDADDTAPEQETFADPHQMARIVGLA